MLTRIRIPEEGLVAGLDYDDTLTIKREKHAPNNPKLFKEFDKISPRTEKKGLQNEK